MAPYLMTFREAFQKEQLWYRKAIIVHTCHYVRKLQFNDKWKMKDTARELGISLSYVSEDIKLAERIDKDTSITQLSRNKALKEL